MLQLVDSIIVNDSVVPAAIVADTTVVQQQEAADVDSLSRFQSGTFFAKDSLSYTKVQLPGMAGDPAPYTMHGDNVLVCLMLLCFIMTIGVFSYSRHILFYHLKEFFYVPRAESTDAVVPDWFALFILNLQTCLLLSITYYFYTTHSVAEDYLLESPYALIAVYFVVFIVYFLLKGVIYRLVNTVFFESKKNKQLTWTLYFITAFEGLAFSPAVILQVYSGLSMLSVACYFVFVLIIAKLMIFYKCWVIFFKQSGVFLQIILYLCALEIVPLLILGGVLVTITNELKVIF